MPMRNGTPMPELTGATQWINGEITREELIGSPVLVHFWALSCHICHDNMPTIRQWSKEYAPLGLKVVAVHMPRQEEDTNLDAVLADIKNLEIDEPCAIDNQHTIGEHFQNEYWPAYFLFDREGNLRGRGAGHVGLGMLESTLKRITAPAE